MYTQLLAKQIQDAFFGGNWAGVAVEPVLSQVTIAEAVSPVTDGNTIAVLTYHIFYYAEAILDVLEGKPLSSKDELSFNVPPIASEKEWRLFLEQRFEQVRKLIPLVEQLPDTLLESDFSDSKYGTYFRNLSGFVEHTHYHLGQIVLLKKQLE